MDDARKKLRVCLIFVVAVAIIFGVIYYFNDIKGKGSVSEGTLVRNEKIVPDEAGLLTCAGILDELQDGLEGRG
ncbi:hypothetical protein ACQRBN_14985 [Bariatricus sp. SGI.154]|uniref:hypothetical protein n=1 Tax=Bariatricus sp. SGI.154 TaxID=3420549 RepID=UPI003CFCA8C4